MSTGYLQNTLSNYNYEKKSFTKNEVVLPICRWHEQGLEALNSGHKQNRF